MTPDEWHEKCDAEEREARNPAPELFAEITIRVRVDARPSLDVTDALSNLANVMAVQAEDGLWSAGYADGDDSVKVADLAVTGESVRILDTP